MVIAEKSSSSASLIIWCDAVEEQLNSQFENPLVYPLIQQLIDSGWDVKKVNLLNPEKVHLLKNYLIKLAERGWEPEQINQLNMSIVEKLQERFIDLLELN